MADNDDSDDQNGTQSGTGDNGTQSGSGPGSDGDNTANNGDDAGQSAQTETVSKAEFEQLKARMQAADQRASKAESDLKGIRDKDLPEAEKLQRDFKDLQESHAKLQATNKSLALEAAFLKANGYKWKDPEAALKLADLAEVEIAEDGKVTGLENALKKLADTKKYLLEDKQDGDDEPTARRGAPGSAGNSTTRNQSGPDTKKLAKKFPALRGRG